MLSIRSKLRLIRILVAPVRFFRGWLGLPIRNLVMGRRGLTWSIDLTEAIDAGLFLTGRYEPGLADLMERTLSAGSVVLDIGANAGSHSLHLARRVGTEGKVIAIEATDYALKKLKQNLALNPDLESRVVPVHAFLCDPERSDVPSFVSASWSLLGDLHSPSRNAIDYGFAKPILGARTLTLDELLEELTEQQQITRVDAIKLDVSGHEVQVLRGARNTLQKHSPLLFLECSPFFGEQLDLLLAEGYHFETVSGQALPSDPGLIRASIPKGTSIHLLARRNPGANRLERLKHMLSARWAGLQESPDYLRIISPGYASSALYAMFLIEVHHSVSHPARALALHDLKQLGFEVRLPPPLPSTEELIRYLNDPVLGAHVRLGFGFWSSRLSDSIQPILELLKLGAGIPPNAMSFFDACTTLDAGHSGEIEQELLRLAKTEKDWQAIETGMIGSLDRAWGMILEILDAYEGHRAGKSTRYDRLLGKP